MLDISKYQIPKNLDLESRKVLLRLDLNVPFNGSHISDDFRIKKIIPTLQFLKKYKAKTIIIAHIQNEFTDSLESVADYINNSIHVKFAGDFHSDLAQNEIDKMIGGDILMFENLRLFESEKENDDNFAKKLADLADVYVNDAFSVSHRKHASIVGIPKYLPSYLGPLFAEEVENLSKAFSPEHPFLFVLGGAKIETKLPLIKKFIDIADGIFVGGTPANSFFKEQGLNIGVSMAERKDHNLKELLNSGKIILPDDVKVLGKDGERINKDVNEIESTDNILDIGDKTAKSLEKIVNDSKFVLWNGPLGNFEAGFFHGTEALAKIIAKSKTESIVGGGDTLAAISKLNLFEDFNFVSTGGGAMLDFLGNGTLPGIEAITPQD